MKLINAYSLGAIATIFDKTLALTGKDLITLQKDQTTGIIWNADRSLCLKLSGNVFDDDLSDSPAKSPGKKRKTKKANTCEGVSASFSSNCATMIESGHYTEDELPLEYRFKIAEHPELDDRFCIINDCDDGLNEPGSVYKLQWKGTKKNKRFSLKSFGGDSTNVLDDFFQFDESNFLTYGSKSGVNRPVVWKEANNNALYVKDDDNVDRYDIFTVSDEPACKDEVEEFHCPADDPNTLYFLNDCNRGDHTATSTWSFCTVGRDGVQLPHLGHADNNSGNTYTLKVVEDDQPPNNRIGTTTFEYHEIIVSDQIYNGGCRNIGFIDGQMDHNSMFGKNIKVSFYYKWMAGFENATKEKNFKCSMVYWGREGPTGTPDLGYIHTDSKCVNSWCYIEHMFEFRDYVDSVYLLNFDDCNALEGVTLRFNDLKFEVRE